MVNFSPPQFDLCSLSNSTGTISTHGGSSFSKHCVTACTPLEITCDPIDLAGVLTYSDNVVCANTASLGMDCSCQAFWTGEDCTKGFLFVYPTVGRTYASIFSVAFLLLFLYSSREIYVFLAEQPSEPKGPATSMESSSQIRKGRSPSLSFNKPKTARANMVSGFFQPSRVRVSVQMCCCVGSFMRFMYLTLMLTDVCPEGGACSALFFEPANVFFISAALLTVMFWKKMGMMFKKGISRANQGEEDMRFFQIFGFYFCFQITMCIVQLVCAANRIQVSALYDISLMISGAYMAALIYGSVKFGYMLVIMVSKASDSTAPGAAGVKGGKGNTSTRAKTWQKIRKVVIMLMFVVPSAVGYLLALGIYIALGMRYSAGAWMPMQFLFRFLEALIVFGFTTCLSAKKVPAKAANLDRDTVTGMSTNSQAVSAGSMLEAARPDSKKVGDKQRAETFTIAEEDEEGGEIHPNLNVV